MNKEEIVQNYVGYVEIILEEGGNFESIDDAINYAFGMYQSDTKRRLTTRQHRFISNKILKEELRKELSKIIK